MSFVLSPKTQGMSDFHFRFAFLCLMHSNERWQLPFSEVSLIRRIDPDNCLRAQLKQVVQCRTLLLSAEVGFFVRAPYHGAEGLLIAEEFRKPEAEARPAKAAEPQMALSLPHELSVVGSNAVRLDPKKSKYESGRPTNSATAQARADTNKEGNRSDAAGKESETADFRFSRPVTAIAMLPHGARLVKFIGEPKMSEEAKRSGAYWVDALVNQPTLMDDLLELGERTRSTDSRLATGQGRAEFLSRKLKERTAA